MKRQGISLETKNIQIKITTSGDHLSQKHLYRMLVPIYVVDVKREDRGQTKSVGFILWGLYNPPTVAGAKVTDQPTYMYSAILPTLRFSRVTLGT